MHSRAHDSAGRALARNAARGQAMIELIIGLVAVLALFAGLVQISTLAKAQNDTLADARRRVGLWAISDTTIADSPDYIRHWSDGPDGSPYTADDTFDRASAPAFQQIIVNRAVADRPTGRGWIRCPTTTSRGSTTISCRRLTSACWGTRRAGA
jgi:hypothetical protein